MAEKKKALTKPQLEKLCKHLSDELEASKARCAELEAELIATKGPIVVGHGKRVKTGKGGHQRRRQVAVNQFMVVTRTPAPAAVDEG